jgi:hypothetical protein
VRVCDFDSSHHLEHKLITILEFVRGVAKEDECEPLFKEYKTCLTVCQKGIETLVSSFRRSTDTTTTESIKRQGHRGHDRRSPCGQQGQRRRVHEAQLWEMVGSVYLSCHADADVLPESARKEPFVHFCITSGEEFWRLV